MFPISNGMKIIQEENSTFVLRFDAGEDVISGVEDFCAVRGITGGHFSAIGASQEAVLSYYNLDTKQYEDFPIAERLEITGVSGNVAVRDGVVAVHAHGTFSNRDFSVVGGHVKRLVISATGEVILHRLVGVLTRAYDDVTGLYLME